MQSKAHAAVLRHIKLNEAQKMMTVLYIFLKDYQQFSISHKILKKLAVYMHSCITNIYFTNIKL